jgi:hypothetical protein
MAYEETVAQRVREVFGERPDLVEKKMFGGIAFMLSGHMCCGVVEDRLMARVGPHQYEEALAHAHAHEMDFTGKSLKGFVFVAPEGFATDAELESWVCSCEDFIRTLPPK